MPLKNDVILALNQEAQARIRQGKDVTNGSIGMMFLDDGGLPVSSSIRAVLARHVQDADLTYSSVAGPAEYQTALRHWFLGASFDEEAEQGTFRSLGTPGGTGAVALAFSLAKTPKGEIVLPCLGWPNYEGIANGIGLPFTHYPLFKDGHFDESGVEATLKQELPSHDHLTLLLNDPCQNPTGYSLSPREWQDLIALLSQPVFAGKITLVIDAAYIDFASAEDRDGMLSALKKSPADLPILFCFSFSKTLSFYGLRLGALAIYCPEKEQVDAAYEKCVMQARALWSVPNHMAMNAVSELLLSPESYAALKKEVQNNRVLVAKRAAIFLKEAHEEGLEVLPYKSGFFLTVAMPDAYRTCDRLKEKDIFLVPIRSSVLRVALCCLPTPKISGLAHAIKEALGE